MLINHFFLNKNITKDQTYQICEGVALVVGQSFSCFVLIQYLNRLSFISCGINLNSMAVSNLERNTESARLNLNVKLKVNAMHPVRACRRECIQDAHIYTFFF